MKGEAFILSDILLLKLKMYKYKHFYVCPLCRLEWQKDHDHVDKKQKSSCPCCRRLSDSRGESTAYFVIVSTEKNQ